jgi:hypothetical protein
MIRDLEYVNGGINSILTMCTPRDKWNEWRELLDTWGAIIGNVIEAMEDEDDEGV